MDLPVGDDFSRYVKKCCCTTVAEFKPTKLILNHYNTWNINDNETSWASESVNNECQIF